LRNPYIVDRPLTDHDLYAGREASFRQVGAWLQAGQRLLLVCGRLSIGVSSFLNQLGAQLSSGYAPVRLELGAAAVAAEDPLWVLLTRIAEGLRTVAPDESAYHAEGPGYAARLLSALTRAPNAPLPVLCLDALPAIRLESDTRWIQALLVLRGGLEESGSAALVLAVEGLPAGLESTLPGVPVLRLGPLNEDESDELLSVPVRGVMTYDFEAIRLIHRLCGGQPYLLQLYGQILFERRASSGWVGLPEARNALDEVLARGAQRFAHTWDECAPRERIVLCAFAEMLGRHGVASAADIVEHLRNVRVHMPLEDAEAALDTLARQGIVDELGGKVYRVTTELLRLWVGRNHTLLDTVRRSRRYHQVREEPPVGMRDRRADAINTLLWLVVAALVVAIAWVWRSREHKLVLVGNPTPLAEAAHTPSLVPSRVLPTPESGVAPGVLVYMSRENEDEPWSLYTMRSDGSDPVRLTSGTSNDSLPVWSPDGRRIAFVSDRDGNREIYVMNADGSDQHNLTRNTADDWTPSWSPAGDQLAFASFRDGNWELYVISADTSASAQSSVARRLTTHAAADYAPAWSPDGRTLAFVSDRDGNLEIYLLTLDSGQVTRFTNDPATDQAPAWSPDGKTLVWESYRDGNMEIYAANADGSAPHNLSRDSFADDHGPTYSPWGGRIAYYSNRAGGWDIYSLNLDTGERTNLTSSTALEQSPNWGP